MSPTTMHRLLGIRPLAGVRQAAIRVLNRVPIVATAELRGGGSMFVDLSSAVGRGLWWTGEFDAPVARALERGLREGDVALDVGANCGFFTVRASQLVGPKGMVFAIDMDHGPLELLRRTRREFGINNCVIIESAVGARAGTVRAEFKADSTFSRVVAGGNGELVPVVRLDDIIPRELWPRIRFIKMDIEGSEPGALDGAAQILEASSAQIAIEVSEANLAELGFKVGDVFDRLEPHGYRCFSLDDGHPLRRDEVGRTIYNVLFAKP